MKIVKTVGLLLFFFSFLIIFQSCQKVYKIRPSIYNPTPDTITSVGYQVDFSADPGSSPEILFTKPIYPDSTLPAKKKPIKVKRGQNFFLFAGTKETKSSIYNTKYKVKKNNKDLILEISRIDSGEVYRTDSEIDDWLKSVSTDLIGDRNRMPDVRYGIDNIMSMVPGIVIIDSAYWSDHCGKDGDHIIKRNSNLLSYFDATVLRNPAAPITLKGEIKISSRRIESNGNIQSSFKFPLATSMEFGLAGKGLYDVKLELKNAGWRNINTASGNSPLESVAYINDTNIIRTTLLNMYKQIKKGRLAFQVREAFMYESLIVQTINYDQITTDWSGDYASVLSLNGAYKRSESADYVNSRPVTISHLAIDDECTETLEQNLELILSAVYLEDKIKGNKIDSEFEKVLPDDIKQIKIDSLQIELDTLKKKLEEKKNG